MALEPPRIGPQLLEDNRSPPTTPGERMGRVVSRLTVIGEFYKRAMQMFTQVAVVGIDANKMRNVDGMPTLTEEQYQKLIGMLEGIVDKMLEADRQQREMAIYLSHIVGRPLPPNWKA